MQRQGWALQTAMATLKQLSQHAMEEATNFPVFS